MAPPGWLSQIIVAALLTTFIFHIATTLAELKVVVVVCLGLAAICKLSD